MDDRMKVILAVIVMSTILFTTSLVSDAVSVPETAHVNVITGPGVTCREIGFELICSCNLLEARE